MCLGVLENGFTLTAVRTEIRVFGVDSVPVIAIQDAVVIGWRFIVTQCFATLVNPIDVPSLGVVPTHAIVIEQGLPLCEVVIGEVEEVFNAFFTSYELQKGIAYAVIKAFDKAANGLGGVDDGW